MPRAALLFISPDVPRSFGRGGPMRAFDFLRRLAGEYEVHLRCVLGGWALHKARVEDPTGEAAPFCRSLALCCPEAALGAALRHRLRRLFHEVAPRLFQRLWRVPFECCRTTPEWVAALCRPLAPADLAAVHVYKLHMARHVDALRERGFRGALHLDVDDLEAKTHRRISDLYARNGDARAAAVQASEAEGYLRLERELLPRFDRLYVCSEDDRATLAGWYPGAEVVVAPNRIRIPAEVSEPRPSEALRLLYVGSLGYYPNQDAVAVLVRDVLPLVAAEAAHPVQVLVAGHGAPPGFAAALASPPTVTFPGFVPDLAPCYADADLVVVPLRAGGGTRIKVLEAFAHRRPVVATPLAVEGLAVRGEEHLLLGETPRDLARQCLRLAASPDLGRGLAERALALVRERYDADAAVSALRR